MHYQYHVYQPHIVRRQLVTPIPRVVCLPVVTCRKQTSGSSRADQVADLCRDLAVPCRGQGTARPVYAAPVRKICCELHVWFFHRDWSRFQTSSLQSCGEQVLFYFRSRKVGRSDVLSCSKQSPSRRHAPDPTPYIFEFQ
jgi:hypothetical protein